MSTNQAQNMQNSQLAPLVDTSVQQISKERYRVPIIIIISQIYFTYLDTYQGTNLQVYYSHIMYMYNNNIISLLYTV